MIIMYRPNTDNCYSPFLPTATKLVFTSIQAEINHSKRDLLVALGTTGQQYNRLSLQAYLVRAIKVEQVFLPDLPCYCGPAGQCSTRSR